MVELVEVNDQYSKHPTSSDDDYSDIEESQKFLNDIDSESDFDYEESIIERFSALVDIVSPVTRQRIYNGVNMTVEVGYGVGKAVGNGLWVLATGALLVLLPVSLELERDAIAIQQEFQMKGQE